MEEQKVKIRLDGLDDALETAKELATVINTARTLADALAEKMRSLSVEFNSD